MDRFEPGAMPGGIAPPLPNAGITGGWRDRLQGEPGKWPGPGDAGFVAKELDTEVFPVNPTNR